MNQSKRAFVALAVYAFALMGQRAEAQSWINWTGILYDGSTPIGAVGTITLPSGTVNVTYRGSMFGAQLDNTGTNHWIPTSSWSAPGVVGPTNSGMIQLDAVSVGNTLSFSQPKHDHRTGREWDHPVQRAHLHRHVRRRSR